MNIWVYLVYGALCVLCGSLAASKGRRSVPWFLISVFVTPIIAIPLVLAMPRLGQQLQTAPVAASPSAVYVNRRNRVLWAIAAVIMIPIALNWEQISASNVRPIESDLPTYASNESRGSALKATPATPPVAPIKISANDLYRDYARNEVAADIKYKGKVLVVTGRVSSIGKDFMGDPYLELQTGEMFSEIMATFGKRHMEQLANLDKGATVSITCVGRGMIITRPVVDCAGG